MAAPDNDPNNSNYTMGSDNIRPLGLDIHNPVFLVSASVIVLFVLLSLSFQEQSAELFGWLRPFLTSKFDWFLVIAVDIMLIFCLVLIVFRHQDVWAVDQFRKQARAD